MKKKTRAVLILIKYAYNSSLHAQTHGYLGVVVLLSHKLERSCVVYSSQHHHSNPFNENHACTICRSIKTTDSVGILIPISNLLIARETG